MISTQCKDSSFSQDNNEFIYLFFILTFFINNREMELMTTLYRNYVWDIIFK